MSEVLKYKGYYAKMEYSVEDKIFFGKILDIDDLILFECEDSSAVEERFQQAVDGYLEMCELEGKAPEKAYNGVFQVRIPPEDHRKLSRKAREDSRSVNDLVREGLSQYLNKTERQPIQIIFQTQKKYDGMQSIEVVKGKNEFWDVQRGPKMPLGRSGPAPVTH